MTGLGIALMQNAAALSRIGTSEQLEERVSAPPSGAEGYTELFAVQAAVWQLTAGGRSAAHDLCISAPTGSGKTLAYALPIVAALQGYVVPSSRTLTPGVHHNIVEDYFDPCTAHKTLGAA